MQPSPERDATIHGTTRTILSLVLGVASLLAAGCASGLDAIDREINEVVRGMSESMDATAALRLRPPTVPNLPNPAAYVEAPPTANPRADQLTFAPAPDRDAEEVLRRLEAYRVQPDEAVRLDLPGALAMAVRDSREYRFAEEDYLITAIELLIERHMWGPRFFDEISAFVDGDGDNGRFDSSLRVVNDLVVTQRLPYGGEVSARALATLTEDLTKRVENTSSQSADIVLAATVPLLRGAGQVAREDLIQAQRDLVYAARDFARFRREFLFDITSDYLDLVVSQQAISNARINVDSFRGLEEQQQALYRAGRSTPFDTAEAQNETLDSIDRLNGQVESYRLQVDRFKVRLGMPVEQGLIIDVDTLALPTVETGLDAAVTLAMQYRLDLQNVRRDQLDDSYRAVEIARNAILGDLDIQASVTIPTDSDQDYPGLDFEPGDAEFLAGITYGLPLDRKIERLQLREQQITLARSIRAYNRFRDDVAVAVRGAVRGIDAALFSLQIQEKNVVIAMQREASIRADPARANVRQKTDAINQISRARDDRDGSRRDLEVAVLFYLLETGTLRVDEAGYIQPLPGLEFGTEKVGTPLSEQPLPTVQDLEQAIPAGVGGQ